MNAVIVEPSADGPLSATELAELRAATRSALIAQQLQLVPSAEIDSMVAGEPQLKGCHSEQCLERLGRLLDAQLVVRYRAKPLTDGSPASGWHLNVQMMDVEIGALGATLTEDCRGCTSKQAADQLGDMVKRSVLTTAGRPRGLIQVESKPQSAAVFVDGTELGITPYKRPAWVGKHKLVVRHLGYRSQQVETDVKETPTPPITVTLVPGNEADKVVVIEREKSPVYKKWWFWVAIGGTAVAAGAIAAGVVLGTQSASGDRMVPPNTINYMF
jgi:hypothetical protein